MRSEGAIEDPATAGSVLAAPGTGGDSNDESSVSTMQEGSDVPVGTETLSDGSVEVSDLLWVPIALAALILGALLLVAVRRRSKRESDPEPPAPHPTVEDMAVITPLVAADVQAAEGEWTRDLLTLDPPGAIDGIVAVSDRLVGFGQAASSNGDAAQAAVWESNNGISWRSVAMLGPGIARLAVPWRDGLLVAAVQGLDERIATTCWWVDSDGRATELAGGEESLQGVVEGGTATDDVAAMWGRGSKGPRIWVAEDGATWRESEHQDAVDLVVNSGGNFVAFGRRGISQLSVGYSTDGISWVESKVENPVVFEGARMVAGASFAGRFVVAGTDIMRDVAATWTTEDGQRWHRTALPSAGSAHIVNLVVAGDRLLALGGVRSGSRKIVAVWESRDAVSWRSIATPELFTNSSATAMAVVSGSIVVNGTLAVERDDAQLESVPVTWRRQALESAELPAQESATLPAAEEPEPMPAR